MKKRDEILATWDTEGIYAEWYAVDSYEPTSGTITRLFVGTLEDAEKMMRDYYSEPAENSLAPFHRCSIISASDAHAFFAGEVDELPSERGEYSITEAAGILDVSRQRVHAMLKSGILEGHKVGNQWSIYRWSVENRFEKTR